MGSYYVLHLVCSRYWTISAKFCGNKRERYRFNTSDGQGSNSCYSKKEGSVGLERVSERVRERVRGSDVDTAARDREVRS